MQPHPAPFSKPILDRIREMMAEEKRARVLDPFAGTGRVLSALPLDATATLIEIEPEFVAEGEQWIEDNIGVRPQYWFHTGDSREWLRKNKKTYTHVISSPTYGNRMKDTLRTKPGTVCRSYAQSKGAPLLDGNTGKYGFNHPDYSDINWSVMELAVKRLVDGGKLILNVSDFYKTAKKGRGPQRVSVVEFWLFMGFGLGLQLDSVERVYTRRFKHGENRHRVPYEYLIVFRKD